MKTSLIFFSSLLIALSISSPLDLNYYHTTAVKEFLIFYNYLQEIDAVVQKLSGNCNDAKLTVRKINDSPHISMLEIRKEAHYAKHKGFILFGEHARELISPETGLKLVKGLCNADDNKKINSELQKTVLDHFDLNIILNANPSSRQKVEQGDLCLRTNENGVDINRNYDDHWSEEGNFETNPGDAPFSEIETQLIRDEMEAFKPDAFLSVHSGTLGMYTPHAYSRDEGERNEPAMKKMLNQLNEKYCGSNCQVGAAGKEVGYLCPGTCIDYAYDKVNVPYSFAWEIYKRNMYEAQQDDFFNFGFLQMKDKTNKGKKNQQDQGMSCFIQSSATFIFQYEFSVILSNKFSLNPDECFHTFNPGTKEQYDISVNNWSNAILELFAQVHEDINNKL